MRAPLKGSWSYWKTEFLSGLDDGLVDALVEHVDNMGKPFAQVHIHHVEGAVSRVSADATAFGHRDAPFVLNVVGMWMDATETDQHIAWVRELSRAVQPFSTGAPYVNFLGDEGEARIRAAYGEEKFARLVKVKNTYDPDNLLRLNQNIRPSM